MSTTQTPLIDVSGLPPIAFDARAPVWWGNLLFTTIESMTVVLLIASYFYLFTNSADWPPPNPQSTPPLIRPLPELALGTVGALLLLISVVPMIWADVASRKLRFKSTVMGLATSALCGAAAMVVRFFEFRGIHFRWDDNAYASLVWSILGLHLTYLGLATGEAALVIVWLFLHGLDEKHAVDVTLTASYWYWMAAAGIVLYAVVYWTPRLL